MGERRETFIAIDDKELLALSKAMGLDITENMVDVNLAILAGLSPEAGTSMQRDIAKGLVKGAFTRPVNGYTHKRKCIKPKGRSALKGTLKIKKY